MTDRCARGHDADVIVGLNGTKLCIPHFESAMAGVGQRMRQVERLANETFGPATSVRPGADQ